MKFVLLIFLGISSIFIEAASPKCKKSEWLCDNGTCIDTTKKCNGVADCPDASDETFLLCRITYCSRGFRCVYGGCAAKNASCNGVKDCVDNSDELLSECQNVQTAREKAKELLLETNVTDILLEERYKRFKELANSCKNGQNIGFHHKCDGKVDCDDGSDETLETCASDLHHCSRLGNIKFRCKYGGCVDQSKVCNGINDCADGSDELEGLCAELKIEGEWYCDDGTRIDAKQTCNGALDCPDGSDETFVLCWNNKQNDDCSNGFRCVYGGCVASNATCNGIKNCADNSDELLLKCRNITTTAECLLQLVESHDLTNFNEKYNQCELKDSLCEDGQILSYPHAKCDGRVDCRDGSDETLKTCVVDYHNCHSRGRFRCRYGGCVHTTFVCDGGMDCADGSDELPELCSETKHTCVLPGLPKNGNYTIPEIPNAYPGQALDEVLLIFTCFPGYKLIGRSPYAYCKQGRWLDKLPKCISQCPLSKQLSLAFWCLPRGPLLSLEVEMECGELVPDGATVRPQCRAPIYHYTTGVLPFMHCVDGKWDGPLPTCSPECGLVTSQGDPLIINGTSAKRGELPWHAAIYKKLCRPWPYMQICGGTLISHSIIISAAHCFWDDVVKLLPAANYAAALGKIYRPWNEPHDVGSQRFDVYDIKIPPRFQGAATNYQDDIALVILNMSVVYQSHIRPICIDFDIAFENSQLVDGAKGKVAGWGLTSPDGRASPVLKVTDLPYVNVSRCLSDADFTFKSLITSDKICAGDENSSAVCKGDSGGGLVFATDERHFLRGVVSTSPRSHVNEHVCNVAVHFTFTLVSKHKDFVQEYWH